MAVLHRLKTNFLSFESGRFTQVENKFSVFSEWPFYTVRLRTNFLFFESDCFTQVLLYELTIMGARPPERSA